MWALRKGLAEGVYFGYSTGEMRLISRMFER